MLTETENQNRISALMTEMILHCDKSIVVIIDGDRTFIPTDSTKYFFEYLQKDYGRVKQIFKEHGYSFNAFHEVAKFYSTIPLDEYERACLHAASCVSIYDPFLKFVHEAQEKAHLILVTAGIARLWKVILLRYRLDNMAVLGGNYLPQDAYVVDKAAKGIIAKALVNAGKTVFAFGDTLIDFDMLAASQHPYIVVNERQNHDLVPLADQIINVSQVTFERDGHPKIPITSFPEILGLIHDYHEKSTR